MAKKPPLQRPTGKTADLEKQALEALRAHRQQSGHSPWLHDDNPQLRAVEEHQRRQAQAERDFEEGLRVYNQKARVTSPLFETLANILPQITPIPPESDPPPLTVRVDPELGRLAVGLGKTGEHLVWTVARHFHGQPGWVARKPLFEALQAAGVSLSRRHFNRLLKQGEGLFWGLSSQGQVYLRAYVKVAQRLTQQARDTAPDLVATNVPGVRDVYVRIQSSIGDFKAQIYAGWLAYRQDPKIARDTLCTLFGCTQDTLRNWEERLGAQLEVVTNYAQTALDPREDERIADYLPAHCYAYVTRRGQIRLRWRQPNTYRTKHIREHPHKGQSRKARTAAAKTAWFQPVEIWAHRYPRNKIAFDRSHREPKRYFVTAKKLRRLLERLENKGKRRAQPDTPRYVYRGEDNNGYGIWELSLDGEVRTTALERMPMRLEYVWWVGHKARMTKARAS